MFSRDTFSQPKCICGESSTINPTGADPLAGFLGDDQLGKRKKQERREEREKTNSWLYVWLHGLTFVNR